MSFSNVLSALKNSRFVFGIYYIRWTIRKIFRWKIISKNDFFSGKKIFEAEEISFYRPKGFDLKLPEQIEYYVGQTYETDSVHGNFYEGANLMGPCAVPVTSDNRIIITSQTNNLKLLDKCNPKHFNNVENFQVEREIAEAICLVNIYNNNSQRNYFHWLCDSLSQVMCYLELEHKINKMNVIIPKDCSEQYLETMQLLGVPKDSMIVWDDFNRVKVNRLFVFSTIRTKVKYSSLLSRRAMQLLAEKLGTKGEGINKPKRIFVSREFSRGRKITNYVEFQRLLNLYDFKTLVLEDLSLSEQINSFANAHIVIGAHGAGLSNIMFCTQGTKVLELFGEPPSHYTEYYRLANYFDLDYYFMQCDFEFNYENNNRYYKENDLTINIKKMSKVLSEWFADEG